MRETEHLTLLKPPQEESGFDASGLAKRRRSDFTVEPHERFIRLSGRGDPSMSNMTWRLASWQPAA